MNNVYILLKCQKFHLQEVIANSFKYEPIQLGTSITLSTIFRLAKSALLFFFFLLLLLLLVVVVVALSRSGTAFSFGFIY